MKKKTAWIIDVEVKHEVTEFMLNAVEMVG